MPNVCTLSISSYGELAQGCDSESGVKFHFGHTANEQRHAMQTHSLAGSMTIHQKRVAKRVLYMYPTVARKIAEQSQCK